jgi:hypothetical protein
MHPGKLKIGEVVAAACGVLLAVALFLPWFSTDRSNPNSEIGGHAFTTVSFWHQEGIVLRVLFLLGAVAPILLLWIVLRQHRLSWPRGEVTSIVAILAITIVLVLGFVKKPGDPTDTISLKVGWFLGLVAAIGMLLGAARRTQESGRPRKPPGSL